MQSDYNFYLIWNKVLKDANTLQLKEAPLPRKRKRSAKIVFGNETSAYDDLRDVKTFYWRINFNVIDS